MFYHSPQVKRWAIITCKHGIYELPHELLNDLRLKILVPRHFRRWGGLCAHTRKKKKGARTRKKKEKKNSSLTKLGKIRKVSKPPKMIA